MSVQTQFPNGTFCYPELCSGDAQASNAFYGSLFGWEAQEHQMPDGSYWGYQLDGVNVGGMYETTEDRKAAGVKPHWNLYVAVDDAHAICAKAPELGGKVNMEPMDMGSERLANLEDCCGAKFCVWQNLDPAKCEATRLDEVGAFCWAELMAENPDKAKDFYSGLFGWSFEESKVTERDYTMFTPAGQDRANGGIMESNAAMGGTRWVAYFQVTDADQTAEKAKELGGQVFYGPMDIETVGRIYYLGDDQGAEFAIIQQAAQAKAY